MGVGYPLSLLNLMKGVGYPLIVKGGVGTQKGRRILLLKRKDIWLILPVLYADVKD